MRAMTQAIPVSGTTYSGGIRSFWLDRADRKPFLFHRPSSRSGFVSGADDEGCGSVREGADDSVTAAIDGGAAGVHNKPFIEPRANLAKPRRDRLTMVFSPSRGIASMFRKWREQDDQVCPTVARLPAQAARRRQATPGFFAEPLLRC
jgi:hypothetical protein